MTTSRSRAPPATLSGGEAQRIRLATQIGAGLMGVLYILDEPSIGLHQRDNERLIAHARAPARPRATRVIVVEHDEDTIRAADYVIDMGPGAGEHGGRGRGRGHAGRDLCLPRAPSTGALPDGPAAHPRASRAPQPRPRRAQDRGRRRQQPARTSTCEHPVRHAHRGHGRVRLGQELAGHGHDRACARERRQPRAAPGGRVQEDLGHRADRQGHRHRPEPHRPHAALQPGHLHRPVGRPARPVREHAREPKARGYSAGRFSLQRERRPLRGVQGRRPDQDRDELPARRLRARARCATARATTARRSRSPTTARTSRRCWT